jgi:hypothetical protein
MASKGKQYKNVYTILEKVKKGEIQNNYYKADDGGGLFGKLNFYKKADLIKPYIHYIDEDKIKSIVEKDINNFESIKDYYTQFQKSSSFKKIQDDQKPDLQKFHQKLRENYEKFPKHLKYDIQKMYYNKIDKLKFEERTDNNRTRYKFLEKANNPVGKIMSEGSNLKSAIFTKQMMLYYMMQMTMMEYTDPNAHQQMQNGLEGGPDSEFNNDDIDKTMDKMMDNKLSKDMLEKAMKDAQDTCDMVDEHIDKDIQDKMFDEAYRGGSNGQAGNLSPDYFRQVAAKLENIKLSMGPLKEKLQKLLDKSAAYFSARKIVTYDDFLNAQDAAGLDDYELLHPKLRKIFLEDLMIKEHKQVGKIDVYVDVSGSMSSGCGVNNSQGEGITKIDFAKSMIVTLKKLDMLNDVYLFDNRVKKYKNDIISISMIDCNGGTSINNAINSIEKVGKNALVITDAEDSCNYYSDKAFFIGVNGARFNGFNSSFMQNNQCVVFDGKSVRKVDIHGNVIK